MFEQVHEDENCHYIMAADGSVVPILKAGLDDATRARIQKKAEKAVEAEDDRAEDAAEGEAEGYDVGGMVAQNDPAAPSMWEILGRAGDRGAQGPGIAVQDLAAAPDLLNGPPLYSDSGEPPPGPPLYSDNVPGAPAWSLADAMQQQAAAQGPQGALEPAPDVGQMALAGAQALPFVGPFVTAARGVLPAAGAAWAGANQPPGGSAAAEGAEAPIAPTTVGGESSPADLRGEFGAGSSQSAGMALPGIRMPREEPVDTTAADAAIEAQKAAVEAQAQIEADAAAAKADRETAYAAQLQAMSAAHARDVEENRARIDEIQKRVVAEPVDANRYWNRLDTGQRLGATIGFILGGFGGSNITRSAVDRAIETDLRMQAEAIAERKAEKAGLLAHYLQRGKDLEDAYALAKADAYAIVAAQLQGTASRYGGMKSIEQAKQVSGQLDEHHVALRDAASKASWDRQVQRAQLQHLANEDAIQRQELRFKMAGRGDAAALQGVVDDLVRGAKVDPRLVERLPTDVRARVVQVEPGKYALAQDTEGAKAIRAAEAARNELRGKLAEFKAIRARNPHGWVPGVGVLASAEDRGRAQALQSDIKVKLKDLAKLGALSGSDVNLLEGQVPDITEFSPTSNFDARLDQLGRSIDATRNAVHNAYLMRQAPADRAEKIRPGA